MYNQKQNNINSVKYGLCMALAEAGMTPEEAEGALSKVAVDPKMLLAPTSMIGPIMGVSLGAGALLGAGSALARTKVENIADGAEDSDMRKKKMKIDMYKKMIADIERNRSARATQ